MTPTAKNDSGAQHNNDTLLAFDFGLRRIGIAVGDRRHGTASALTTLVSRGRKADFAAIAEIIAEWRPARLIVGRPSNMDGSSGEMTPLAERFAARLGGRFGLPVDLVDERLSSVEAQDMIREARRSGRARRSRNTDVDKLAAQVILRSWLDRQDESAPPRSGDSFE